MENDIVLFLSLIHIYNLNDIAKDNPEIVIDLAKKWKGESKEVDWIIKHGCRTLLKQGIPEVMELFGFDSIRNNTVSYTHLDVYKRQLEIKLQIASFTMGLNKKNELYSFLSTNQRYGFAMAAIDVLHRTLVCFHSIWVYFHSD